MVTCLILAAGKAERMGKIKALLPFSLEEPDKRKCSALEVIVQAYRDVCINDILVVTGYHSEEIEDEAHRLNVRCVRNKNPEQGMFSSVQTGLAACTLGENSSIFVHPADCPLVRPITLIRLASAGQNGVKVPFFGEESGHPIVLPARIAKNILQSDPMLGGGLKKAVEKEEWAKIPVPDSFILDDMDLPEDYERIRKRAYWRNALDLREAYEFMREWHLPEKALSHGKAVGEVAFSFAKALRSDTCNPELARVGGLVHDFAKGGNNSHDHERIGGSILTDLGLSKLAHIVASHRDQTIADTDPLTEREIVYLADKYCMGSKFVPISERFGQKLQLYAHDAEACTAITRRMQNALIMEARVKRECGQEPSDIAFQALRNT